MSYLLRTVSAILAISFSHMIVAEPVPHEDIHNVTRVRHAAEQGNALYQFRLGQMYETGEGVPQDYEEAIKWYMKSAKQGDPLGQSSLASMYLDGNGGSQNYELAAKWYSKAADQGEYISQHQLGAMYQMGHGVPQDYVLAHKWYNLAASHSFPDATPEQLVALKKSAASRDGIAKFMTKEQIAEAQKLAREWKKK